MNGGRYLRWFDGGRDGSPSFILFGYLWIRFVDYFRGHCHSGKVMFRPKRVSILSFFFRDAREYIYGNLETVL